MKRNMENLLSLFFLQGINYILPLLTIPYQVRVLGTGNFGIMTFALVFNQYFIIMTDYGFNITATQEIAKEKENMNRVARIYSNVMGAKFILLIISAILLTVIVNSFSQFRADAIVYYAAFLTVIGNAIFPIWLYQGLERMKYISVLSSIMKFTSSMSIFIFVKQADDYLVSTFIQSLAFLLPGILSLIIVRRKFHIKFTFPSFHEIGRTLKSGFYVFITTFLSSILTISGTFFLGIFYNKEAVGIYSAVDKLIKAVINLFTPFLQVLFPKVSAAFAESYEKGVALVRNWGLKLMIFVVAMGILLISFSQTILSIIYGKSMVEYSFIFVYLIPWIAVAILNNLLGIQYMVGIGRSKEYSICFTIASIITVLLFLYLIPNYSFTGTVLAINLGELILTLIMVSYIKVLKKGGVLYGQN